MTIELIHISFFKLYRYKGWYFEYDRNKPFGPWPIKPNGEPMKRASKKFYEMFDEFYSLPVEEQEKHSEF
jgi:hypothetical protein